MHWQTYWDYGVAIGEVEGETLGLELSLGDAPGEILGFELG